MTSEITGFGVVDDVVGLRAVFTNWMLVGLKF